MALIHGYILWLRYLPRPRAAPNVPVVAAQLFEPAKVLAANQGFYNGFLAASLVWARLTPDPTWHRNVGAFFLECVAVTGIYGALTAGRRILLVQTGPVLAALLLA